MELDRMLENIYLKNLAIDSAEESGIVFIDEIDKICSLDISVLDPPMPVGREFRGICCP